MDQDRHRDAEAKPKVAMVAAEQAESFAILRRPQIESDQLPERHGETLEGGFIGRCGLNPDLARRAVTDLGDVWVVPGNGFIALVVGGMTCSRTEIAARQGMVTWTSDPGVVTISFTGSFPMASRRSHSAPPTTRR